MIHVDKLLITWCKSSHRSLATGDWQPVTGITALHFRNTIVHIRTPHIKGQPLMAKSIRKTQVFIFGMIIPTFRKYYFLAMKKYYLGEFEEIVLLTIAILNKDAYGVAIKKEIESQLSRDVSMGGLHTALLRLEDKGYVRSVNGDTTEERAGRPRRYFEITALGKKAIAHSRASREKLWGAIPNVIWELNSSI